VNSKNKGKRGERELAKVLKEYGFPTRRGQQYSGLGGDDVVGLEGIHVEWKSAERLNVYDAVKQACRDAEAEELPAVFWRKNNEDWLVTMKLEDWIALYKGWLWSEKEESKWQFGEM
jgi:Holliday junction resolvase